MVPSSWPAAGHFGLGLGGQGGGVLVGSGGFGLHLRPLGPEPGGRGSDGGLPGPVRIERLVAATSHRRASSRPVRASARAASARSRASAASDARQAGVLGGPGRGADGVAPARHAPRPSGAGRHPG